MTTIPALPLVSIVITSYNREKYIWQAIESALAQDYHNLEIIISDNCSSDGTMELIKKYLSDSRIKWFQNEENIGMIPNFRRATFELARGELITYISSDDYLTNKNFITQAVDKFINLQNISVVSGRGMYLLEESKVVENASSYEFYKNSFFKNGFVDGKEVFLSYATVFPMDFGGCMMRLADLKKIKCFDSHVIYGDIEITAQLSTFGNAYFIDEPTYVLRIHSHQEHRMQDKDLSVYINNVDFIETPYNFAKSAGFLTESQLNLWKEEMVFKYLQKIQSSLTQKDFLILIDELKPSYKKPIRRVQIQMRLDQIRKMYHSLPIPNSLKITLSKVKRYLKSA